MFKIKTKEILSLTVFLGSGMSFDVNTEGLECSSAKKSFNDLLQSRQENPIQ